MSKQTKHYGYFRDGKFHADTFKAVLRGLKERNVPVVLTVAEDRGSRSSQANRYYWGVIVELIHAALKESGWEVSREGTHDLLKFRFLKEDRPLGTDGEFVTFVKSTTELNREEFGAYLEHCIRFAAEYLNVVIPEPGTQMELAA